MTSEEQKTRALIGIKGYLGDLVKVMTAINENLAELGKIIKEGAEGPSPAWTREDIDRNRVSHTSEFNNPEHRPLNYEEMEERSAELLRNNPVSQQIPKEGE
jgi:hypothetical protein